MYCPQCRAFLKYHSHITAVRLRVVFSSLLIRVCGCYLFSVCFASFCFQCISEQSQNFVCTVQLHCNGYLLSLAGAATSIIFGHDKHFVATNASLSWRNTSFVAAKVCLSQQNYVCCKHMFVMTKVSLLQQTICRNKLTFVTTNTHTCASQQNLSFVATKICLSQQSLLLSRQNRYLWQLLPMIICNHMISDTDGISHNPGFKLS